MEAAIQRPVIFQQFHKGQLYRKYNTSCLIVKSRKPLYKIKKYENQLITCSSTSLKRQRRPQNVDGDFFVGIFLSYSLSFSIYYLYQYCPNLFKQKFSEIIRNLSSLFCVCVCVKIQEKFESLWSNVINKT